MSLFLQKSLRESIAEPEFVITDFAKFDRPGPVHIGWQALHNYQMKYGTVPRQRNKVGTHMVRSKTDNIHWL